MYNSARNEGEKARGSLTNILNLNRNMKGYDMQSISSRLSLGPISSYFRLLLAITAGLTAAFITGCGGSSSWHSIPAGTSVTVLASSTANDQLSRFSLQVTSLTLTSQSGEKVTVISTPQNAEFIHLNGTMEPLVTASVPQGVYTAASVSVDGGFPVCAGYDPADNSILTNGAIGSYASSSAATANLPAPITVTGTAMGLALDLQASESVSSFDCVLTALGAASITPTFNLTPVTLAAQPTNSGNGKATGLRGLVTSVNNGGTSFSVAGADGPTWQLSTSGSTVYQGITGVSQLAVGMPVDMEVAIQQDGSLLATWVGVYDTNPSSLTVASGPSIEVAASEPVLLGLVVENEGPLLAGLEGGSLYFSFGNSTFQTSNRLTNIQSLPFAASFNGANMVPGQNVLLSTHASTVTGGPTYIPATTVTLQPQTINGTVSAISSSGSFTTYIVTLAPYDLFPDFAVLPGQTTLLTNPGSIVVYVDGSAQMLNTDTISVGSVLRFNGLVFNDNGTLRMDCAQVNDGVAE